MAAGFKYEMKDKAVNRELWQQETTYRLSGGFNLVDADIDNGTVIPSLAPLFLDFKKREAKVVKNVKAYEAISGTTLKVDKGSLVKKDMHIGNGTNGATISEIDKTNAAYDTLTLSGTIAGVKAGDVLFEATTATGKTPKRKANYMNYTTVRMEAGASLTAVGQAYEIETEKLYLPVSEQDKKSLGDRFMFI